MAEHDVQRRLACTVRTAREQRGWTQDQLADEAGVSRPTVQRCETARTVTRPATRRRLFQALGRDLRLAPVLLSYVTADETDVPAAPPREFSQLVEEAV